MTIHEGWRTWDLKSVEWRQHDQTEVQNKREDLTYIDIVAILPRWTGTNYIRVLLRVWTGSTFCHQWQTKWKDRCNQWHQACFHNLPCPPNMRMKFPLPSLALLLIPPKELSQQGQRLPIRWSKITIQTQIMNIPCYYSCHPSMYQIIGRTLLGTIALVQDEH